ncbi:MAG: SRPBCC family protein [Woeseiaceae bacterium]|nr:SRPBCC family protein [Woeseiaceae bacterium]
MQKLFIAIVALIALVIIIGFSLPRYTRVEVSDTIDANPATVFALINDLERAALWSPVVSADPNARIVYSGPQRGIGATMTWDGAIAGTGVQVITESVPWERVTVSMNPGEVSEALTVFEISRAAGGSEVVARYEADHGYRLTSRVLGLIVRQVFRRDFEQGLASLREIAESLPRADFGDLEIEHLSVEAIDIAYLSATSPPEPAAMSEALGDAYFEVLGFIDEHGLTEAGAPLSILRGFVGSSMNFDAAIPVRGLDPATPRDGSPVRIGRTYAGPVIRVKHVGSYRTLGETQRKIASYLAALGIERNGDAWESYVSDPTKVAESDLITYVYYPVKP